MNKIKENVVPMILLILLFIIIIPIFKENSLLIVLITILFTGVSFAFFHSKKDILIYLLGFVLVSFGEVWLVYNQVWIYPQHDLFGIPYYTPFIWGYLFLNFNRFITSITNK